MRRFTRVTNALSKHVANHRATAVAVYFMSDAPRALRVTPALEAGLADHVSSIEEIVGLLARPEVAA
jgi:hypothetical protein